MDETQRFSKLKESIKEISGRKIRLEERFNSEKERLEKLLTEISAKGYDPKNLGETRKAKEAELAKALAELEGMVKDAEQKLDSMEGK